MPELYELLIQIFFTAVATPCLACPFSIITAIVTSLISYSLYKPKLKAELHKEFESRLNERKWNVYTEFAESARELLFKGTNYQRAAEEFSHSQTKICGKLWIVASDEVIKAYQQIQSQTAFGDQFDAIMETLTEMRKDLGYDSTKTNAKDLMSIVGIDSKDKLTQAQLLNWRSKFAEPYEEQ
jgi:hypothetical protein